MLHWPIDTIKKILLAVLPRLSLKTSRTLRGTTPIRRTFLAHVLSCACPNSFVFLFVLILCAQFLPFPLDIMTNFLVWFQTSIATFSASWLSDSLIFAHPEDSRIEVLMTQQAPTDFDENCRTSFSNIDHSVVEEKKKVNSSFGHTFLTSLIARCLASLSSKTYNFDTGKISVIVAQRVHYTSFKNNLSLALKVPTKGFQHHRTIKLHFLERCGEIHFQSGSSLVNLCCFVLIVRDEGSDVTPLALVHLPHCNCPHSCPTELPMLLQANNRLPTFACSIVEWLRAPVMQESEKRSRPKMGGRAERTLFGKTKWAASWPEAAISRSAPPLWRWPQISHTFRCWDTSALLDEDHNTILHQIDYMRNCLINSRTIVPQSIRYKKNCYGTCQIEKHLVRIKLLWWQIFSCHICVSSHV